MAETPVSTSEARGATGQQLVAVLLAAEQRAAGRLATAGQTATGWPVAEMDGAAEGQPAAEQPGAHMVVDAGVEARNPETGEEAVHVSFVPRPGLTPVTVQYAKPFVYVSDRCNSDNLKWALVNHIGQSPSAVRVTDGFSGKPYDRFRPIVNGPNHCGDGERLRAPLIITPAYGPF